MVGVTIETERVVLRPWRDEDRAPFAALNADPRVMAHFPSTLAPAESDAFVDRHATLIDRKGWGLWALERRCDRTFLGFTAVGNENSRRMMEKIGLIERHEFDHPLLPDHPRQRHVLYSSIRAEDR